MIRSKSFLLSVILLALIPEFLGPSLVGAAPKTVAILNMSTAAESADLAAEARNTVDAKTDLRTTSTGDLSRAFEGPFPTGNPDQLVISQAVTAIDASEQAFASFQKKRARESLENARNLLFSIPPSPRSNQLLADVSFQMALAHLRDLNTGLAKRELQLLHRLDDREGIDPVRYPPDVVTAFTQSRARVKAMPPATSTVEVSATYDGAPVYLDGHLVGTSPIEIKLVPGMHLIAIAAPKYQTKTLLLEIDPQSKETLRIDLKPRSAVVRALEMRHEASQNGLLDEHIRQAAARTALLVGSDAVLVILDSDKGPRAALYDQRLDRLSYRRPVDENLGKLLGLIIETPRPSIIERPGIVRTVPWYRSSVGIAAIGGTAALTISILGFLSLSGDNEKTPINVGVDPFPVNSGIQF